MSALLEAGMRRLGSGELEAYRFTWRSSFDGGAAVDIASTEKSTALYWEARSFTRLQDAPARALELAKELAQRDWEAVRRAVDDANFWSLEGADDVSGFDGAEWLIEGYRGKTYHAVERWSPRGTLYDLGRLFFALAGRPLAEIELY